jgi:CelD/BcsL family acetyltransferase involved in cellulose biosynthesis
VALGDVSRVFLGMKSELVTSMARFEGIRGEWNALEPARLSPLLRWEWFYAAASAFHKKSHLKLTVVRRADRIAGIAPMVEVPGLYGKALAFIGSGALHEPCEMICGDLSVLEPMVEGLLRIGSPFVLEGLSLESSLNRTLVSILKPRGRLVQKETGATCFLSTARGDYEGFLAGLPSKRRYDLKRLYHRAGEAGPVHCEIVNPAPGELQDYLDKVFEVESKSWKMEAGSAILANPEMEDFFRRFCAFACEEGYLRIALLRLQDRVAAAMIGAELGGRFWIFKIGYDEEWSRYSPGILMINETIRYSFEKNLVAYEFLGSNESWIHLWTGKDNLHPKFLVAFYPYNVRGGVKALVDASRLIARRLSNSLRPGPVGS